MGEEVDITDLVNWKRYLLIDNSKTGIMKMIKKEDFYKELLIKGFEHWDVYLHENQYFLGRSYIRARRKEIVDFFDMNNVEIEEYLEAGKRLKRALTECFHPDLFNHVTLTDTTVHLHTDIIPRYKKQRRFSGIVFKDERLGKNYAQFDKNFRVKTEILFKIRDSIRGKID